MMKSKRQEELNEACITNWEIDKKSGREDWTDFKIITFSWATEAGYTMYEIFTALKLVNEKYRLENEPNGKGA